jgi:hypothetical protein
MSMPQYVNNHIIKLYEGSKFELGIDTNSRIKKFKKIIHLYYPWATYSEIKNMIILIYNNENEYQQKYWKDTITKTYKYDIVTLFGTIDNDSNKQIDINEFISTFSSITDYTDIMLRKLFDNADADKNGSLDILEFIELLAKYPLLRDKLELVLQSQQEINKQKTIKRLSVLFKNLPNSPNRINWRPSLFNLHSPTTIKKQMWLNL